MNLTTHSSELLRSGNLRLGRGGDIFVIELMYPQEYSQCLNPSTAFVGLGVDLIGQSQERSQARHIHS